MNQGIMQSSHHKSVRALLQLDPYLEPYQEVIIRRMQRIQATEKRLLLSQNNPLQDLRQFALGHLYYGLHRQKNSWIFREWAPNAQSIYFLCQQNSWQCVKEFALHKCNNQGDWEITLPLKTLQHLDLYKIYLCWPGGEGFRLPSYTRRVIQDKDTLNFDAQVWDPGPYVWQHVRWHRGAEPPLIYEAHIGMAQEKEGIGSYAEFTQNILPRIVQAGYNTLQLMGIPEHPYYGSFGYHVTNFFAPSSRFGPPEALKELIDTAHGLGLSVIIDLVHSHAASNTAEGLAHFDGSNYLFHAGARGHHPAWGSKCFDYNNPQTLHFLLSNCAYWLNEFKVDGFRFDGITSMLYTHHGLGKAFTSYADYFDHSVDEAALTYLALVNKLIHQINPAAITIAEDVSGMPGLALKDPDTRQLGFGFDYRFAMGIADCWIKIIKEYKDEDWPLGLIWHELTNRRRDEKTISYAESHDQALVGDKTLIFRLADAALYEHMHQEDLNLHIDRALALHKMIRLITITTAGNGYLNFMGNEFGHPEWIDFPREGNNWSYKYAKRQWSLADSPDLKYRLLARFDRDMIDLVKTVKLLQTDDLQLLLLHEDNKIIAFQRGKLLLAFNFHPQCSFVDFKLPAPRGSFQLLLDSDRRIYGGHGRLTPGQVYHYLSSGDGYCLSLYLPSRTAIVLAKITA